MPLTLGFDTSAASVRGALVRDGDVLGAYHEDMARGQAERLMPMLEALLQGQGLGWRDIERIGVGVGPGNFTGIRISVSAARGLAMGLDVPAIGVSLHPALAYRSAGTVRTAIDARRGHVYIQDFRDMAPLGPPQIHALDDLPESPAEKILGPAAKAARQGEFIARAAHAPAAAIALIAEGAEPGAPPAPLYIRAPDADPPRDPAPVILDA